MLDGTRPDDEFHFAIHQRALSDMRALAILFICGSVAGCAVGPDYVKPKVETPQDYRFADKDVKDTANTEWWKQFEDPVLDQLIAEALVNNKNIQIAAANVEQAAGVLTQTRSQYYPQVNYNAAATRQRASPCCSSSWVMRSASRTTATARSGWPTSSDPSWRCWI